VKIGQKWLKWIQEAISMFLALQICLLLIAKQVKSLVLCMNKWFVLFSNQKQTNKKCKRRLI
jgi:hypothetical protein